MYNSEKILNKGVQFSENIMQRCTIQRKHYTKVNSSAKTLNKGVQFRKTLYKGVQFRKTFQKDVQFRKILGV